MLIGNRISTLRILFLILIFLPAALRASENSTAGSAKSSEKQANPVESDKMPEWVTIQNEISMILAKMNASQGGIRKLLEEKKSLPENSPRVKPLIDELVKAHKELTKLNEQFEQQRNILKYRFPERAVQGIFSERIEVKSLEEMEQDLSLDQRLERNVSKMRSQYGTKSTRPKTQNAEKPIEESGSVILRK